MLVLLSFMLQAFLILGGGLRPRTGNGFLRILTWIAYLGADLVAAYALGLISRPDDEDADPAGTHQLVFMWAPFLLVHLWCPGHHHWFLPRGQPLAEAEALYCSEHPSVCYWNNQRFLWQVLAPAPAAAPELCQTLRRWSGSVL